MGEDGSNSLPYMPLYFADWTNDTRILNLSTKGAWIDILGHLWKTQPCGQATLPLNKWRMIMGAEDLKQASRVIEDLRDSNVANIVWHDDQHIEIVSRRMVRDRESRAANAKRVSESRRRDRCGCGRSTCRDCPETIRERHCAPDGNALRNAPCNAPETRHVISRGYIGNSIDIPTTSPRVSRARGAGTAGEEEGKKRKTAEARAAGADPPGDHAPKTAQEAAQALPDVKPGSGPAPPPPVEWRAWKRLFPAELATLRSRTPEQLATVAGALDDSPAMVLAAAVDVATRETNGDRTTGSPMARIKALLRVGVSSAAVARVKGAVAEVAKLDQDAAARERLRQAVAAEERAPPSFAVVLTCCDRCGDERKTDDTPDFRALLNNRKAKCFVSGCYGILEEIPEDTP